jgi:hypothetical protein
MGDVIEFRSWGRIPRLFREVMITEKIDGTNAAIGIRFGSREENSPCVKPGPSAIVDLGGYEVNGLHNVAVVYAQSRKRIIRPGDDNHGFAGWVRDNAETLVADLGEGLHFGEWWGQGIQRGYGLDHKRFSLFNVTKWQDAEFQTPNLGVVPVVLESEEFSTWDVEAALDMLASDGSYAAPGFYPAEGVVVYHKAGNTLFKATLEGDEAKGMAA